MKGLGRQNVSVLKFKTKEIHTSNIKYLTPSSYTSNFPSSFSLFFIYKHSAHIFHFTIFIKIQYMLFIYSWNTSRICSCSCSLLQLRFFFSITWRQNSKPWRKHACCSSDEASALSSAPAPANHRMLRVGQIEIVAV